MLLSTFMEIITQLPDYTDITVSIVNSFVGDRRKRYIQEIITGGMQSTLSDIYETRNHDEATQALHDAKIQVIDDILSSISGHCPNDEFTYITELEYSMEGQYRRRLMERYPLKQHTVFRSMRRHYTYLQKIEVSGNREGTSEWQTAIDRNKIDIFTDSKKLANHRIIDTADIVENDLNFLLAKVLILSKLEEEVRKTVS